MSQQIRAIFERHTPLVEPLSLDEAYLDVTHELTGIPTATETAETIRREIREETHLTASAGVAPNKFLAKIASDWRKPDGIFVIRPHQVEQFLVALPVRKIPGVGKATEAVLHGDEHRHGRRPAPLRAARAHRALRQVGHAPVGAGPRHRREPGRAVAQTQVVVEREHVRHRHHARRSGGVDPRRRR